MILQVLLLIAAALFATGLYGTISQQPIVMVMMGLELMLNGVLLAGGALWWWIAPTTDGQIVLLLVLAAMTVEMAVGFGVAVLVHRSRGSDLTDSATELHS